MIKKRIEKLEKVTDCEGRLYMLIEGSDTGDYQDAYGNEIYTLAEVEALQADPANTVFIIRERK